MSKMIKKMLLTGLLLTAVVAPVQELSATKTTFNDLYPKIGKDLRDVNGWAWLIGMFGFIGSLWAAGYGLHNKNEALAISGVMSSIASVVVGLYGMLAPSYQRATPKDVMNWGQKKSTQNINGDSSLAKRLIESN